MAILFLAEPLFFICLYLCGLGLLTPYFRQTPQAMLGILAIPAGVTLVTLAMVLQLMLGMKLHPVSGLCIALIISCIIAFQNRIVLNAPLMASQARWLCGIGLFTLALHYGRLCYSSNDSILILEAAQWINRVGFLGPNLRGGPQSYGIVVPLLHSVANLWGAPILWSLHPLVALSIIILIGKAATDQQRRTAAHGRLWAALLPCLLLASTPFFLFHSVYLHTNLLMSLSILLWFHTLAQLNSIEHKGLGELLPIWLLGIGLTRTEGPIYVAILVAIRIIFPPKLTQRERSLTAMVLTFLSLWNLWIGYSIIGRSTSLVGNILDFRSISMIAFTLLTLSAILYFSLEDRLIPILKRILGSKIILPVTILVAAFLVQPVGVTNSIQNILAGAFYSQWWGCSWGALLILLLITHKTSNFDKPAGIFLRTFPIILIILSLLQSPYTYRWGDSATRMLMHIFPLAIWYLATRSAIRISSEK